MDNIDIVEKLNGLRISQENYDIQEDIPEDIWEEYFEDAEIVDDLLDVEKHRHYETSVTVFKMPSNVLIGVRHATDLFSEMMTWKDTYHTLKFFYMKEITTITYEEV